jgi:lysophospholipid acyltransferase 1/2
MCLHLVSLVTIFVLPKIIKGEQHSSSQKLTKKSSSTIENQVKQTDSDLVSSSNDLSPPNNFMKNTIHNNFLEKNISIKTKLINDKTDTDDNFIDKNANNHEQNFKEYKISSRKNSFDANCNPSDSNLSHIIKEKIEIETRNIEELFDKTVNGIVELKDDLMRMNENQDLFIIGDGLRKRAHTDISGVDTFLKKEIEAINAAVF